METATRDYRGVTTKQIVAEMLTENTGKHFLDSGGAYGRNWQRNQGVDFDQRPAASARFDYCPRPGQPRGEAGKVSIAADVDLYHWMVSNLEFDAEMQERLDAFAEENPSLNWLQLADEFAETYADDLSPAHEPRTHNTYNDPDYCHLSQTVQYIELYAESDYAPSHLILSVHGGCDVRGGYSAPKCFKVEDSDTWYERTHISGVAAGDNTWWWQSWCETEPGSLNECTLDLPAIPCYDLEQALEAHADESLTALKAQAERDKLAIRETTLASDPVKLAEAESLMAVTANQIAGELRDAAVTNLAQDHEWFILCDSGKAWLFSQDDTGFEDGRAMSVFVD